MLAAQKPGETRAGGYTVTYLPVMRMNCRFKYIRSQSGTSSYGRGTQQLPAIELPGGICVDGDKLPGDVYGGTDHDAKGEMFFGAHGQERL